MGPSGVSEVPSNGLSSDVGKVSFVSRVVKAGGFKVGT